MTAQPCRQKDVNVLIANHARIERVQNLELAPILSIRNVSCRLALLEIMTADDHEHVVPQGDCEL